MEAAFWTILALNIASVFIIAHLNSSDHSGEDAMSDTVTTIFLIVLCAVADLALFFTWLFHKLF